MSSAYTSLSGEFHHASHPSTSSQDWTDHAISANPPSATASSAKGKSINGNHQNHTYGSIAPPDSFSPPLTSSLSTRTLVSSSSSASSHLSHPLANVANSGPGNEEEFKQYLVRWLVLGVFSLLTITNAIIWICFAPIQDLSCSYFGVSKFWINALSMCFMLLYLPGYFLAFWLMESFGFRFGLVCATVLQTVGAWVRYMSIIGAENNMAPQNTGFIVCMIGQCLAGLAQPMFTNSPARLSSDWFGIHQRNLATTIAAMANPIGIAIGQLVPTALVDSSGGMPTLLLVCSIISSATCLLCILCVKNEPPTPPSRSSMERAQMKENAILAQEGGHHQRGFWHSPLIMELKLLLSNKQFLLLMLGVGAGLGLFNAVTTLIEQLVSPAGYDKDDAGDFGALIIGCGLVGAGIVGPIMDYTHAYNRILKAGLIAATLGTVFVFLALRPGEMALVSVGFGALGFVMLPLLPVCMECAAECTYPASEDASSGLLLFAGNILGIGIIVLIGDLIDNTWSTVFNPATIAIWCILIPIAVVVGIFYNGPMKRQAAEKAQTQASSDPLP